ncbi:MAG: hypothetical protein K2X37_00135 [Chitinophagaceae bacterium]|nr:hypothetical protein [Chitinophagaceae bacterium]
MPLQYLSDNKGNTTAVLVPIDQWHQITKLVEQSTTAPDKKKLLKGIKDALHEVKLIEAGKKKATTLKAFLDEL